MDSNVVISSWQIVFCSAFVLIVFALLLLMCVCWKRKHDITQLYKINQNGLIQNSASELASHYSNGLRFLTKFSFYNNEGKQPLGGDVFTSDSLPIINKKRDDLLDSDYDISNLNEKFKNTVLSIDGFRSVSNIEETNSNGSTVSKNTFYSVYPGFSRMLSRADTYKSLPNFETEKEYYDYQEEKNRKLSNAETYVSLNLNNDVLV